MVIGGSGQLMVNRVSQIYLVVCYFGWGQNKHYFWKHFLVEDDKKNVISS